MYSNCLTLNLTKCKYMVVSRKRCPSAAVSLSLGGTEMEKVDCFKYLGLLLSSDMSFGKHIVPKPGKYLALITRDSTGQIVTLYCSCTRQW